MKLQALLVLLSALLVLSPNAWAHQGSHAADAPKKLPLGDGKISTSPQAGYVVACRTSFPGGGGADRVGEWIEAGFWQPSAKPTVPGQVQWPHAAIDVALESTPTGDFRVVRANNLPTHASGVFPIARDSQAYQYDRNPNSIRERSVLLRLPSQPQLLAQPACVPLGMIGFALSGVAIFNAFDLQGRDAPAYEIQDSCNGHPERNGSYHYHDWSPCLAVDRAGRAYASDEPVGWMLDGFPILGPRDEKGKLITNSDLDECHGRLGAVRVDGQVKQMYHYRFTLEYPYTIGCFRGQPIAR
jgi:hypothetical protein